MKPAKKTTAQKEEEKQKILEAINVKLPSRLAEIVLDGYRYTYKGINLF